MKNQNLIRLLVVAGLVGFGLSIAIRYTRRCPISSGTSRLSVAGEVPAKPTFAEASVPAEAFVFPGPS